MTQILTNDSNISYYIKTAAGSLIGPYASRAIVESIFDTMPIMEKSTIVQRTADGKEVLFG